MCLLTKKKCYKKVVLLKYIFESKIKGNIRIKCLQRKLK